MVRFLALSLCLASFVTAASAADNNSFTLLNGKGKSIGRASYTLDKTKDGFHVRSHFEYHLAAPVADEQGNPISETGPAARQATDAQYSSDYKIDANGEFLSGYTQNAAAQMVTSFQPSKQRDLVTIAVVQGGVSGQSHDVPLPTADFLFASDFDPSAIQVLLLASVAHPRAENKYTLLVPGGPTPRSSAKIIYVALQAPTDANGTLDGKPVALKHYVLKFYKGEADLYGDAAGNLMEADMAPIDARYVRAKFALAAQ